MMKSACTNSPKVRERERRRGGHQNEHLLTVAAACLSLLFGQFARSLCDRNERWPLP